MTFTMQLYVSFGSLKSWSCLLASSLLSSVEHILLRKLNPNQNLGAGLLLTFSLLKKQGEKEPLGRAGGQKPIRDVEALAVR